MILHWGMPFTFAKAVWHAAQYFWHGFPVIAPPGVIASRMATCQRCPFHVDEQCSKCACFINVKTMLSSEKCPDQPSRWNRLTTKQETNTDSHVA